MTEQHLQVLYLMAHRASLSLLRRRDLRSNNAKRKDLEYVGGDTAWRYFLAPTIIAFEALKNNEAYHGIVPCVCSLCCEVHIRSIAVQCLECRGRR